MNTITAHGNIVRAEVHPEAGEKKAYAKLTLASDRSTNGDSATDFFPVVGFDPAIVEFVSTLNVGDFVKITGTVKTSPHDGRITWQIVAKRIERPVRNVKAA